MSEVRLKLGQERRTLARQAVVQVQPVRAQASRGRKASVHRLAEETSGKDARGGDESIGDGARDGRERAHSKRVGQKKGALAAERLTRFLAWRTSGRRDSVRASIVAFDEMWTYLGVRRGERRQDLWIWTAVVEERDGVRWRMYEVGDRDLSAFSRLLDRLPGADRYETDAYGVYE